jgi:hypothetical protein
MASQIIGRAAAKYGVIEGVLSSLIFFAQTRIGTGQNRWATLVNFVVVIALVVLAQREIKQHRNGVLTYVQGLGSGTLLGAVGAVVRAVLMYVYVQYINTGYLPALLQTQRTALERRGITGAQAQMAMGITASFTTPIGIVITSLVTGVVIAFIVALIVSLFTQSEGRTVIT